MIPDWAYAPSASATYKVCVRCLWPSHTIMTLHWSDGWSCNRCMACVWLDILCITVVQSPMNLVRKIAEHSGQGRYIGGDLCVRRGWKHDCGVYGDPARWTNSYRRASPVTRHNSRSAQFSLRPCLGGWRGGAWGGVGDPWSIPGVHPRGM